MGILKGRVALRLNSRGKDSDSKQKFVENIKFKKPEPKQPPPPSPPTQSPMDTCPGQRLTDDNPVQNEPQVSRGKFPQEKLIFAKKQPDTVKLNQPSTSKPESEKIPANFEEELVYVSSNFCCNKTKILLALARWIQLRIAVFDRGLSQICGRRFARRILSSRFE